MTKKRCSHQYEKSLFHSCRHIPFCSGSFPQASSEKQTDKSIPPLSVFSSVLSMTALLYQNICLQQMALRIFVLPISVCFSLKKGSSAQNQPFFPTNTGLCEGRLPYAPRQISRESLRPSPAAAACGHGPAAWKRSPAW